MIFEMFASGRYGLVTISRTLEERGILTRTDKRLWDNDRIKSILKNDTYAGVRYFNRIMKVTDANRHSKTVIRGKWIFRDRAEWIAVTVPPIVPRELFHQVQKRLRYHDERYCQATQIPGALQMIDNSIALSAPAKIVESGGSGNGAAIHIDAHAV